MLVAAVILRFYHLHTLRHFYATYLLQEGTSKQVAASLLGHADTAFLERTYCHPQDVAKRQAANLMQDLLNNQNPCYVAFMKNKNSTQEVGKLILKIDSLPADKKASFSAEEIHLMRTTVNQLRNERLAKGQYTDAADDMLLKLF